MNNEEIMVAHMYLASKKAKTLPRKVGGGDRSSKEERDARGEMVRALLAKSGSMTITEISHGLGQPYETAKRALHHAISIDLVGSKPIDARRNRYFAKDQETENA